MSSSSLSVPTNVKFDEAISLTQSFATQLKNDELTSTQIQDFVSELVSTSSGARGFFVTYLIAPDSVYDEPRSEIVTALGAHPEITADLLVKNIAMSTAQQLHHQRQNDSEMAASSARVAARTTKIIQQLNLPQIQAMCRDLVATIERRSDKYNDFLNRWGYDEEQKNAIAQAVSQLVKP